MRMLALCVAMIVGTMVSGTGQEAGKPQMTPKELEAALKEKPATDLAAKVESLFGKWALDKGKTTHKQEGTTFAWAVKSERPAVVRKTSGEVIGRMQPVGKGYQALAKTLPNFQEFDYEVVAGGEVLVSKHVRLEHYDYTADSLVKPDVSKGIVTQHQWNESEVFPNTQREYLVYIPAQYKHGETAALMVFQDGLRHANPEQMGGLRATTVFDNLIARNEMPVTVGIFINPGRFPNQKPGEKPRNRSVEYDSLGDAYARFLLEEIIPQVVEEHGLTLSDDPADWGIAGGSSGAACAWTVAWERPDKFGKVLSWVGTFVDIRGANAYPSLIRKTEPKPIRAYLLAGENDLDNQFGNWPLANQQMQKALEFMGYDYHFHYGKCFHGSRHAAAMLPEMLRWLWRDHSD